MARCDASVLPDSFRRANVMTLAGIVDDEEFSGPRIYKEPVGPCIERE